MSLLLILGLFAAVLGLAYASFHYAKVKKMDEGTEQMQGVASAIRIGANAFIRYEYKILLIVVIIVAGILAAIVSPEAAVCFVLGATMSGSAGWIGMKIATYANVRVTNAARNTKSLGEALKVAFRGGSVMGLCVGACALFGLLLVYLVFGLGFNLLDSANMVTETNWLGVEIVPFTMCLSGYALGCSVIAMFNRVGGGIYTKAADMGADLVGKTEARIPEDDPRNPATIADNVGDNVGDVAGLGSDLLESYVGSLSAAAILAVHLYLTSTANATGMSDLLLNRMLLYPVLFSAAGLLCCMVGIFSLLSKKTLKNPHKELNLATYISAGLTTIAGFIITYFMFRGLDTSMIGFKVGAVSPMIGAFIGILAGIFIGATAEYYTSSDYKPTKRLAHISLEGPALTITQGLSLGMRSCAIPCIILGSGIIISYYVSGLYGVAMAAAGMLSFVTATVSVDTYGPISDNAGGIAEMSGLEEDVRRITDTLDSVGNTTAAIGKGFAIGSGALAALSLMVSYLYSYNDPATPLSLNLIEPITLAGAIIGGALPFLFSGMLIEAVTKAARKMVDEVRRQFREIPGILGGTELPDYKTCIEISSKGAISEMKVPAFMAILVPVFSGFLLGPEFVGGILIGSTICSIMLAILSGNAGGAWDNGKKYIESGAIKGVGKGTDAHAAAVVGDTVGDPLKDTVGPCLDIFIKIMSTVSLISVAVFNRYNVLEWVLSLFKQV
jgi:K(+)-stimulated pyrophosphate-energized sodium pump